MSKENHTISFNIRKRSISIDEGMLTLDFRRTGHRITSEFHFAVIALVASIQKERKINGSRKNIYIPFEDIADEALPVSKALLKQGFKSENSLKDAVYTAWGFPRLSLDELIETEPQRFYRIFLKEEYLGDTEEAEYLSFLKNLFLRKPEQRKHLELIINCDWKSIKVPNRATILKLLTGEPISVDKKLTSTTTSWQNIYLVALKERFESNPRYKPPENYIDLSGKASHQRKSGEEEKSELNKQYLKFGDELRGRRRIILSGPSGSGKTTIQKKLIIDLLLGKNNIFSKTVIPIFVSLKDINSATKSIRWLIEINVRSTLEEYKISNDELVSLSQHFNPDAPSSVFTPSELYEIISKRITENIYAIKEDENECDFAIFLDGLNEVIPEMMAPVEAQVDELLGKDVIFSLSSHQSSEYENIFGFELRPLDNDQIIEYLDRRFDNNGDSIFQSKITNNSNILEMARTPFFLELISNEIQNDPSRQLPRSLGLLLQGFVERNWQRKRKSEKTSIHVNILTMWTFLGKLAYRMIEITPSTAIASLNSLTQRELLKLFSNDPNLEEKLRCSALIGILDIPWLTEDSITEKPQLSFNQEFVRDYFAAYYLKDNISTMIEESSEIEKYLEYKKWDNALVLLFGIVDDISFEKLIRDVIYLDPFFAAKCLCQASHSVQNLAKLSLDAFESSKLLLLDSNSSAVLNSENYYDMGHTYPKILSNFKTEILLDMFNDSTTTIMVSRSIPMALGVCRNTTPQKQVFVRQS